MWGKSKLAQIVCSGSLTPHFVNNDDVTTEITCSPVHALHEVRAWLRGTLCCREMSASPRKQWHITAASWLCLLSKRREYSISTATAAASTRREHCVSQEKINISGVPMAP